MTEKKERKLKFVYILFALSIVSAVFGFCDLKSHAEELPEDTSEKWYCYVTYDNPRETFLNPIDGSTVYKDLSSCKLIWEFDNDSDIRYAFVKSTSSYYGVEKYNYKLYGYNFVTEEYVSCNMKNVVTYGMYKYYSNGNDVLVGNYSMSGNEFFDSCVPRDITVSVFVEVYIAHYNTNIPIFATSTDMDNYLKTGDRLNELIDYDNLPIDDDMPVVENLLRNTISDYQSGVGLGGVKEKPLFPSIVYDFVSWNNTSDEFCLQLQSMNVAQFFKVSLSGSEFLNEYYDEWLTREIFTTVTNNFIQISECSNMYTNSEDFPDTYVEYMKCSSFVSECESTYDQKGTGYPMFAYRIRYVDIVNKKAGPWVVLLPGHDKDGQFYISYIEYSDTSSEYVSADGLDAEYDDLSDVDSAVESINTENNFKDKYEIIDNEVDVQEATTWLKTVFSFIKTAPSVIGSALSFLPQPILYGIYVCIFLGVIAGGIAIVKALI